MTVRNFTTTIMWHDSRGGECFCEVEVAYEPTRGYVGSRDEPGEPDRVEIIHIEPLHAGDELPTDSGVGSAIDDCMLDECFEHWQAEQDEAAERKAEQRVDDRMMERGL